MGTGLALGSFQLVPHEVALRHNLNFDLVVLLLVHHEGLQIGHLEQSLLERVPEELFFHLLSVDRVCYFDCFQGRRAADQLFEALLLRGFGGLKAFSLVLLLGFKHFTPLKEASILRGQIDQHIGVCRLLGSQRDLKVVSVSLVLDFGFHLKSLINVTEVKVHLGSFCLLLQVLERQALLQTVHVHFREEAVLKGV